MNEFHKRKCIANVLKCMRRMVLSASSIFNSEIVYEQNSCWNETHDLFADNFVFRREDKYKRKKRENREKQQKGKKRKSTSRII